MFIFAMGCFSAHRICKEWLSYLRLLSAGTSLRVLCVKETGGIEAIYDKIHTLNKSAQGLCTVLYILCTYLCKF